MFILLKENKYRITILVRDVASNQNRVKTDQSGKYYTHLQTKRQRDTHRHNL